MSSIVSGNMNSHSGSPLTIAGYIDPATPVTIKTTLTHIMLGDQRIATIQSQSDEYTGTRDTGQLIYHVADHLNSSSLDISSTGVLLQVTDTLPFGQTITYSVASQRIK